MSNRNIAQPGNVDTAEDQCSNLKADKPSFAEVCQFSQQKEIALKLLILIFTGYILKLVNALDFYPIVWIPILLPPLFEILAGIWHYHDKDIRRRYYEDKN